MPTTKTYTVRRILKTPSGTYEVPVRELTGTGHIEVPGETIADEASDQSIPIAIDVSAVKAILLFSDRALTVKTNDAGSPDETINLVAGVEQYWDENMPSGDRFITTDVTGGLFVSNSSGADATLVVYCLYDATPS